VERGLVGSLGMEVVGVEMLGNLEEDRELKVRYVVLGIVDIIACMSSIVPVLRCDCSMSSA
jgi:hypothetical protein